MLSSVDDSHEGTLHGRFNLGRSRTLSCLDEVGADVRSGTSEVSQSFMSESLLFVKSLGELLVHTPTIIAWLELRKPRTKSDDGRILFDVQLRDHNLKGLVVGGRDTVLDMNGRGVDDVSELRSMNVLCQLVSVVSRRSNRTVQVFLQIPNIEYGESEINKSLWWRKARAPEGHVDVCAICRTCCESEDHGPDTRSRGIRRTTRRELEIVLLHDHVIGMLADGMMSLIEYE